MTRVQATEPPFVCVGARGVLSAAAVAFAEGSCSRLLEHTPNSKLWGQRKQQQCAWTWGQYAVCPVQLLWLAVGRAAAVFMYIALRHTGLSVVVTSS